MEIGALRGNRIRGRVWPYQSRRVRIHPGHISADRHSKLFLPIAAAFAEAERDRVPETHRQMKADQKGGISAERLPWE